MLKNILKISYLSTALILAPIAFSGCENMPGAKKTADDKIVKEVVVEPETLSEWKIFKTNAEKTISSNKEKIADIKSKISPSQSTPMDKMRLKRIETLEERNAALYNKIYEYKGNELQSDWAQFKMDVEKELIEIEKAFNDLEKEIKNK
jgi:hypothetical protein